MRRHLLRSATAAAAVLLLACSAAMPAVAAADVVSGATTTTAAPPSDGGAQSALEQAANQASSTGRAVAMRLIALAFAVAAIVLSFRRDFKEAAGVFVIGVLAVLLATPAGVNLLRDTVTTLFGS